METTSSLEKIKQIYEVRFSDVDSINKINLMLSVGWKIVDRYKIFRPHSPSSDDGSVTLYFILGHEDPNVEIPMTKYEFEHTTEYILEHQKDPPDYD